MTDTCNAVGKDRGKNRICERPLRHDGKHKDGDYEWDNEQIDSTRRTT